MLPHFVDSCHTDGAEIVSLMLQAIPITGRGFLEGSETLRLPHFVENGQKISALLSKLSL
jgi:hypothetical protein